MGFYGPRYLIHDRDPLYTRVVADILTSAGIPAHSAAVEESLSQRVPERFVRSIKEECLTRVVPLGDGHLRLLAREHVEHYHPIKDSTTGFCNTRHCRNARPPPSSDATASADSSVFTIERPRDWSAYKTCRTPFGGARRMGAVGFGDARGPSPMP
jgi:hypothetical protein